MHDGHDEDAASCPMIMTVNTQLLNKQIINNTKKFLSYSSTLATVSQFCLKVSPWNQWEEFASAVTVIFLISIAYEGLTFWREKFYNDYASETATVCSSIKMSTSELTSSTA